MTAFRTCGFLLLLMFPLALSAQEEEAVPDPTGLNVLYRKELHGGPILHSHGFGGYFRSGTHVTGKLRRFWEVDATTLKHPKEFKTSSGDNVSRGFVFGKMNSVIQLRGGVGYQRRLHGRDEARGVEVRGHIFAGPSLALAKPVYLQVRDNTTDKTEIRKYDPNEHQFHEILGRASVLRGITEIRPYPGFYVKSGLAFEYGGNFDAVKGLECGVVVDGYLKELPIMAFTDNHQVIVSLYLSLFFGKRFV